MNNGRPILIIFAGVNGAGKTTLAYLMLLQLDMVKRFLNADNIARGLSPLAPKKAAVSAGKILLRQIDDLIAKRESFALETTLSSKAHLKIIKKAQAEGFHCLLHYIWLPDVSYSHERVKLRVAKGGHSISSADIERRYPRSIENFWQNYRMAVDKWYFYTNIGHSHDRLAHGSGNDYVIEKEELWNQASKTHLTT